MLTLGPSCADVMLLHSDCPMNDEDHGPLLLASEASAYYCIPPSKPAQGVCVFKGNGLLALVALLFVFASIFFLDLTENVKYVHCSPFDIICIFSIFPSQMSGCFLLGENLFLVKMKRQLVSCSDSLRLHTIFGQLAEYEPAFVSGHQLG